MKSKKTFIYVIIVYLVAFCACMATNITGPMLNDLMNHYSIGLGNSGIMSSLQNIGCVAATVLVSLWLKKYNQAAIFCVPVLVMGLSVFLIGTAPAYAGFMILYFIMGLGISTSDIINNALIPGILYDRKTAALSILHGLSGMGAITLAIFSGVILDSGIKWNNVYKIAGAFIIVLAIAAFLGYLVCGKEVSRLLPTAEEKKASSLKEFLSDKRIIILFIVMILYAASQSGVAVWMPQYCREVFGANAVMANGALIAYWAGAAPFRILFGATRLGRLDNRKVLIYGNIAGGIFLIIGMLCRNYAATIISIFLYGVLTAVAIPLIISIAGDFRKNDSSLVSSVMMLGLYVATIIIPIVIAKSAAACGMNAIVIISAVLSVLSGFLVWLELR